MSKQSPCFVDVDIIDNIGFGSVSIYSMRSEYFLCLGPLGRGRCIDLLAITLLSDFLSNLAHFYMRGLGHAYFPTLF